jgi:predicted site-specific integrase-resolvase
MPYVSTRKAKELFGVCTQTLRVWADTNKIKYYRTPCENKNGSNRMYDVKSIQQFLGITDSSDDAFGINVIYARVSSSKQKDDLQRQIEDLQRSYPEYTLFKDIGSGLNYKRKGLQTLLEQVYKGNVKSIVVSHKDRLCRFGSELLEQIFNTFGTKLVVHSKTYKHSDDIESNELRDDLLAVTTYFVAKHNGKRAAANRKKRKLDQEQSKEKKKIKHNESNQL